MKTVEEKESATKWISNWVYSNENVTRPFYHKDVPDEKIDALEMLLLAFQAGALWNQREASKAFDNFMCIAMGER